MTATHYLRLFTFLLFASSVQPAFAQKKAANTSKNAVAKANTPPQTYTAPASVAPNNPPAAQPPAYYPSEVVYLETGTPIFLETKYNLDSKFLEEGKMVCLYVKYPVKVQGRLIIPAGREAWCRINRLVRPQGNGRAGLLEIEPMHIKTNDGQLVMLTGNQVSRSGRDREILAQTLSIGTATASQQMTTIYQQQMMRRQMQMDLAYQDQQQQIQQDQMNPNQQFIPVPDPQQNTTTYGSSGSYGQAPQQGYFNPTVLGTAANPALMGVATALNIISPFISIMIKGKRAKLPKGYTMKAFVGYGLVIEQ
jgi:hypothetical protein